VITIILKQKYSHFREVKMKTIEYDTEQLEYYKNNAFPAIDNNDAREEVVAPQVPSNIEGNPTDEDPARKEQEKQMEAWMSDIKAFIRGIDISKL
jgi:hypothetical protein